MKTTALDAHILLHADSPDRQSRHWDLRLTGVRPLTINKVADMHRQAWARHTKEVRKAWWALALEARIPKLQRAHILVLPLHRNHASPQDVGGCAPECKGAVDGIVDAGVLPNDDPAHLLSLLFLPALVCGNDGLHLRVVEA